MHLRSLDDRVVVFSVRRFTVRLSFYWAAKPEIVAAIRCHVKSQVHANGVRFRRDLLSAGVFLAYAGGGGGGGDDRAYGFGRVSVSIVSRRLGIVACS